MFYKSTFLKMSLCKKKNMEHFNTNIHLFSYLLKSCVKHKINVHSTVYIVIDGWVGVIEYL